MPGGQHSAANGFMPNAPGLNAPIAMSFGAPCNTSMPNRMIGLEPRWDNPSGEIDLLSEALGVCLPFSRLLLLCWLCATLISGELFILLREGTRALFTLNFSSQTLPFALLDFDDGRSSAVDDDDLVSTFISYGLNASGRISCGDVFDFGVFEMVDGDLDVSVFNLFFSDETVGFTAAESAPIWLHVWAKSASGLFLASIWNYEKKSKSISPRLKHFSDVFPYDFGILSMK